jgi:hypothetical protein
MPAASGGLYRGLPALGVRMNKAALEVAGEPPGPSWTSESTSISTLSHSVAKPLFAGSNPAATSTCIFGAVGGCGERSPPASGSMGRIRELDDVNFELNRRTVGSLS